jgi:hypothetical protein
MSAQFRKQQFHEVFPDANCGNVDWSSNYWGEMNGINGGASGSCGGGGARVNFFADGGNILGTSDGVGFLSEDFHKTGNWEIVTNGNSLSKNAGKWGYWSMATKETYNANSDIQTEFSKGLWLTGIDGLT